MMEDLGDISQHFDVLMGQFRKISRERWFSLSPRQKMDSVRDEIRSNPSPFLLTLESPNLIGFVSNAMLSDESIIKYMLKYPLTSYLKIMDRFNKESQDLFARISDHKKNYVTIDMELEYFSEQEDKVLPFPRKKPVIKGAWQFQDNAGQHHWFNASNNEASVWYGVHSTLQGKFKYKVYEKNLFGFSIQVIERETDSSGCFICPRVFAPVLMELWEREPHTTHLASLIEQFQLDERLARMTEEIKKENPCILQFKKYKQHAVDINNLYRQCVNDIESFRRHYFGDSRAIAEQPTAAVGITDDVPLFLPPMMRSKTCAD